MTRVVARAASIAGMEPDRLDHFSLAGSGLVLSRGIPPSLVIDNLIGRTVRNATYGTRRDPHVVVWLEP